MRADQGALTLVVSNLASNAIKYTPEGGRIKMGVAREADSPGSYCLFVEDTGIGLAPGETAKLLNGDAYYRTARGKKMTDKGFGIGLTLVKLVLEAHGSALRIESEMGKGSRFSFLLPVEEAVPDAPAQAALR